MVFVYFDLMAAISTLLKTEANKAGAVISNKQLKGRRHDIRRSSREFDDFFQLIHG